MWYNESYPHNVIAPNPLGDLITIARDATGSCYLLLSTFPSWEESSLSGCMNVEVRWKLYHNNEHQIIKQISTLSAVIMADDDIFDIMFYPHGKLINSKCAARSRKDLPIHEWTSILEAVNSNQFVGIEAETGSGKSTHIPQYLLDSDYRGIVCGACVGAFFSGVFRSECLGNCRSLFQEKKP